MGSTHSPEEAQIFYIHGSPAGWVIGSLWSAYSVVPMRNFRGDIMVIVDAAGSRVVEYRHALRRICRAAHFGQDMSPYDFCGNAKEDASGWLKPFPDGESAG